MNNNIKEKETLPSFDNLKSAIMFFILTVGVTYLCQYQTVSALKKCKAKELSCTVLNNAAKIVPSLFGTITIFFLELCIVADILRLKGFIRTIVYTIILITLPFVYLTVDSILQSIHIFG